MAARRNNINNISVVFPVFFVLVTIICSGCPGPQEDRQTNLKVPRGYVARLDIQIADRLLGFGPFVGYYFKPENPKDLTRLSFVCFNEDSFYTSDLPENARLFEGDAILRQLVDTDFRLPSDDRINPVFFGDAPPKWVNDRPLPRNEYLHFHSCYDGLGPVLAGYWIRHQGKASFTYDMGGRIGPDSPLYHEVHPGIDKQFAKIMEFDTGPNPEHVANEAYGFSGSYVYTSNFLIRESRPYKSGSFSRVKPNNNFDFQGGLGAWEIAIRRSYFD